MVEENGVEFQTDTQTANSMNWKLTAVDKARTEAGPETLKPRAIWPDMPEMGDKMFHGRYIESL